MKNKNKLWFKAKMYGWGWQPVSREGWAISVLYTIAVVLHFKNIDRFSHSISDTLINFAIPFIITTIFLLIICYARGERLKWRWG